MNQRKTNKRMWLSLDLAVFLCIAALMLSVGTAQARYRAEREANITFSLREPEQICRGMEREVTAEEAEADPSLKEGDMVFDSTIEPQWVMIDDTPRLTFSVANGISKTDFSARDQKIRLRLLGGIGFWTGEDTPKVYLRMPSEEAETGYVSIQANVRRIVEGTALYHSHGDGWLLSFYEKENEESRKTKSFQKKSDSKENMSAEA